MITCNVGEKWMITYPQPVEILRVCKNHIEVKINGERKSIHSERLVKIVK